jgi:hypothetical protein
MRRLGQAQFRIGVHDKKEGFFDFSLFLALKV